MLMRCMWHYRGSQEPQGLQALLSHLCRRSSSGFRVQWLHALIKDRWREVEVVLVL